MPLSTTPSTLSAQRFQPLPCSAPPRDHRRNFAAMLLGWHKTQVNIYNACRRYIRSTGFSGRIPNLATMLNTLFGSFCGAWLYAHITESAQVTSMTERLLSFVDPEPAYVVRPPSGEEFAAMKKDSHEYRMELAAAQAQFKREVQTTLRAALAGDLQSRGGYINPRGFVRRWLTSQQHLPPHARLSKRLADLFGAQGATLLDTTQQTSRLQLARQLRDIK